MITDKMIRDRNILFKMMVGGDGGGVIDGLYVVSLTLIIIFPNTPTSTLLPLKPIQRS